MATAKRDSNFVTTAMGVLDSDGVTPTNITADPTTHILQTDDSTTGTDSSGDSAYMDSNFVKTLIVVSENDGSTPVQLYVDSSGNLLVDSN